MAGVVATLRRSLLPLAAHAARGSAAEGGTMAGAGVPFSWLGASLALTAELAQVLVPRMCAPYLLSCLCVL